MFDKNKTLDVMNDTISYLSREYDKTEIDHRKRFLGTIHRGTECIKSFYIITDTIKCISDYFKDRKKNG